MLTYNVFSGTLNLSHYSQSIYVHSITQLNTLECQTAVIGDWCEALAGIHLLQWC